MVIDTHIRPALFAPICENSEVFQKRCNHMNYHLMKPTNMDLLKKQFGLADIQKAFLLPSDCSYDTGTADISNDDIAKLVALDSEMYIGFASVDPRNANAASELEKAFTVMGLSGLYINTARLKMDPEDKRLYTLYDLCRKYGKPVIFHAGLSLETDALARYARPMDFEQVLHDYPEINICLTHVGWPWVQETAALLLKYPNAYTNTALMNFDGPYQIFHKVFKEDMGDLWVEHNISDQIMFGSDSPRIRPVRSKRGLDSLNFTGEIREKIYYRNALRFLGLEG
ncbi:MAG TPA: amidohydrolase family protein [Oscillospiraceae bacterium]|nr:amidohydrolase family protein [Oscillospiraceae bacterium]